MLSCMYKGPGFYHQHHQKDKSSNHDKIKIKKPTKYLFLKIVITSFLIVLSIVFDLQDSTWLLITIYDYIYLVCFVVVVVVFRQDFSVKQSCCPGTHSVDQASLELTEIWLPLPPEGWDKRCVLPSPGYDYILQLINALNFISLY